MMGRSICLFPVASQPWRQRRDWPALFRLRRKPARRQPRHMVLHRCGAAGLLLLSSAMTLWELRQLKSYWTTLDDAEQANTRLFNDLLVQKLRNHSQLSAELERARGGWTIAA